jgi:hypothetical protein
MSSWGSTSRRTLGDAPQSQKKHITIPRHENSNCKGIPLMRTFMAFSFEVLSRVNLDFPKTSLMT